MVNENSGNGSGRRSFLKAVGVGWGLSALPVAGAKGGPGNRVELDTSEYGTLDRASVTRQGRDVLVVEMGGTVPPGTGAGGYTVSFPGAGDGTAGTDRTSVDLADARLAASTGGPGVATQPERGEVSSSDGSDATTGTEGFGTSSHDGGDLESDYEGGAFVVSKDVVNLNLAKTEHWLDWSESSGNVDWASANGHWTAWKYTVPPSDWDHNGSSFTSYDFGGSTVDITYKVDYINWTWNWNHLETEAFHRVTLVGNPDGYLNWGTTHWHTGEDAGSLHANAGHYSNSN